MKIFQCKSHPEFKIVAQSYETRNSWGHKAYLVNDNNYTMNTYKITYYNRTWECYQYQSVIKSVLYDYMTQLINDYINDYKDTNNIKRLNHNLKQQLTDQAKMTPLFEKLNTFYGEL
jgi:hypothetical protein